MKSPSERGVTGAWAYQARAEADLSVEEVADRVTAKGQPVSAATIRGIESGNKKPSARLLRMLADVLDSAPPGPARQPEASLEERAVIAAERQAEATVALAAELLAWRTEDRVRLDRLEAWMDLVIAGDPAPRGNPGADAPRAPRAKAG